MEAFLSVAVPDGVGSGSVPTLTLFLELPLKITKTAAAPPPFNMACVHLLFQYQN